MKNYIDEEGKEVLEGYKKLDRENKANVLAYLQGAYMSQENGKKRNEFSSLKKPAIREKQLAVYG